MECEFKYESTVYIPNFVFIRVLMLTMSYYVNRELNGLQLKKGPVFLDLILCLHIFTFYLKEDKR